MEDKQIGVPTNVAVFIDYENVYKALLEEKTNVLRLAFFEKLRKWLSSIMYPFFNKLDVCLKKVNTVMYCHQKTTSVAPSPPRIIIVENK